jgi:hypothetical protein
VRRHAFEHRGPLPQGDEQRISKVVEAFAVRRSPDVHERLRICYADSGPHSRVSAKLKTAALPATPTESERTAVIVKIGLLASRRIAWRKSDARDMWRLDCR